MNRNYTISVRGFRKMSERSFQEWYETHAMQALRREYRREKLLRPKYNRLGRLAKEVSEISDDLIVLPVVGDEVTDCIAAGDRVFRPYLIMPDGKRLEIFEEGEEHET